MARSVHCEHIQTLIAAGLCTSLIKSVSSADVDDWERLEDQPQQEGIQNVLYLNDEDEEEEEEEEGDMEMERGQEVRKVAVRRAASCVGLYPCFLCMSRFAKTSDWCH